MTTEEAIKILEAGEWWAALDDYCYQEREEFDLLYEATDLAVGALRAQQKVAQNIPLTLDELREMDGEPVWVIPLAPEEQPEWALVDVMEEWLCTSNADYWGLEVYGRCILAYRRKPEV